MKANRLIISILLSTFLVSCKSSIINTSKNLPFGGINESINLYAFVGEKISVIEFDPNENQEKNQKSEKILDEETGDSATVVYQRYIMDNAFRCKYKIIRKLFNDTKTDTIEFLAYDHYGNPAFAEKDTVILYLSKSIEDGHFFHQKYQFDNVFKDENGNYFSYPKFNGSEDQSNASLKGFDVNLKNVNFDVSHLNDDAKKIYYPKEFYKIENNIATPVKGIYLYQLIIYRLNTTFKDL
ncbi:hypothetical protein [Epilithonimonas sp. UC225_85]|uniref:hypothetical protein n=1 Tax=Epilithonimonas sp. UC225_85 TaxID=3350167 RepID=UPI0036D39088